MFSIIMPIDEGRFEQFEKTKRAYDAMPQEKEFVLPTRSATALKKYLKDNHLEKGIKIIPYTLETGFNCSKALNIGVKNAKFAHVIITSPEVLPKTEVLGQFEKVLGENVLGQVWDEKEDGSTKHSLINTGYHNFSPAFYFLAMFNKADIEKINGWDEEFLKGYAFEDMDFGARWVRAGLPFVIRDDIQGIHQYHPRSETVKGGWEINKHIYHANTDAGIIRCKNGLVND